jgi:ATP-dependent Clp protease adaptor protein ClpS
MSSPGTIELPEVLDSNVTGHGGWIVTVFNNDYNTWDEVVFILMAATGCDEEEANIETWEIDNLGRSVVHQGPKEICETAAEIIAKIGIRVEVSEG